MHNSDGLSAPDYASVTLTDSAGNVIVWNFTNVGKALDRWNELCVKIGFNENSNSNWIASVGSKAAFNWYVTEIKIMFYRDAAPGTLLYLLLDGLKFPAALVAANDQTSNKIPKSHPFLLKAKVLNQCAKENLILKSRKVS